MQMIMLHPIYAAPGAADMPTGTGALHVRLAFLLCYCYINAYHRQSLAQKI